LEISLSDHWDRVERTVFTH